MTYLVHKLSLPLCQLYMYLLRILTGSIDCPSVSLEIGQFDYHGIGSMILNYNKINISILTNPQMGFFRANGNKYRY